MENSNFPPGVFLGRFEGREMTVQGHSYLLERTIYERYDDEVVHHVGLFEGKRLNDNETVILKIRFQLRPDSIPEKDRATIVQMAEKWFREEAQCLRDCQSMEHRTPHFYGQEELVQGPDDLFPGGYLHIIVMSKVPGSAVTSYTRFTQSEIVAMRHQLAATLEHIRVRGWGHYSPDQEDLFFDRDSMHLSLVGLSGIPPTTPIPGDTITETSFEVTSFGLDSLPQTKN